MKTYQNIKVLHKLLNYKPDKKSYKLTPEQQQRIREAKAEYLAGNVLSEQQADEAIDKWLEEK